MFPAHHQVIMAPIGYPAYEPKTPYRWELKEIVHHEKYDMDKYRSHEDVQQFICNLRGESKRAYPLTTFFENKNQLVRFSVVRQYKIANKLHVS